MSLDAERVRALEDQVRRAFELAARSVSPDPVVRAAARRAAEAWQAEIDARPSAGQRLARALREAAERIA